MLLLRCRSVLLRAGSPFEDRMETDRGKGETDAFDRSIQVSEHFRADDTGYFRSET